MTSFITYEKDATITDAYSATCAMRVIWGGDRTIQEIRKSPLPPRSTEITFADRYSFGILNGSFINQASDSELQQLAKAFYNDTYLMDQNACSAPHLLFWQEGSEAAKKRFWNSVYQVALDYELEDQKVSDKYSLLCEKVTNLPEIATVEKYNNLLYVVNLDYEKMNQNAQDVYRGIYGLFYQTDIERIEQISPFIDERIQTCAVFGVSADEIQTRIIKNGCHGLDRIVPFGETLNIGVYWDGYDLIRSMSRCITY